MKTTTAYMIFSAVFGAVYNFILKDLSIPFESLLKFLMELGSQVLVELSADIVKIASWAIGGYLISQLIKLLKLSGTKLKAWFKI